MDKIELLEIISSGEDSRHQFKKNITNANSIAGEMAAFANTKGGMIIIGVDDDGNIIGISNQDINRINQLIANAATNNIKNPLNPLTENVKIDDKVIIVVNIEEGIDKPYLDNDGVIWVKSGADKRRVTSREEIRRLFESSDLLHADEVPIKNSTLNDIDREFLKDFVKNVFRHSLDKMDIPLNQFLENLGLMKGNEITLAGLMIFGKNPQKFKPQFVIKAISFVGNDISSQKYIDSEDIEGKIQTQFYQGMAFIKRNLKKIQRNKNFNTQGEIEIPEIVLEELLANALMHRNYFIDSPVKLFIFENRVEMISPGVLPNNLTVESIKNGVSNIRNPRIASFITKNNLIPYRGIGTGVMRSIANYPDIDFLNEEKQNQFRVVIERPV